MLEEQPAEHKLALVLLAAGLVSGAAAAVCWLCGIDPAGGASLSTDTLRAAAVGGAAAAPLVAFKASLWSEPARRQLPFLDDIHKAQADAFKPVMANLNGPQTVVLLASGVASASVPRAAAAVQPPAGRGCRISVLCPMCAGAGRVAASHQAPAAPSSTFAAMSR
jgi:hypothetical protein